MHQQNMINHVAICHTKTKDKWHCQLCGKQYSSKESFQGHYKGSCTPLVMASGQAIVPFNTPVSMDPDNPQTPKEGEQADTTVQ